MVNFNTNLIFKQLQLREIQMLGAWGELKRLTMRRLSEALKQEEIIYTIHTYIHIPEKTKVYPSQFNKKTEEKN